MSLIANLALYCFLYHLAPTAGSVIELYHKGNIKELRAILNQIPDTTAAGKFLQGLFTNDASVACRYYEGAAALASGSQIEAAALERLVWYHRIRGDKVVAEKYQHNLQKLHPNYKSWSILESVKFTATDSTAIEPNSSIKHRQWSVQVGAFSNRRNAEAVGRAALRFAPVEIVPKSIDGKTLFAVCVGRFVEKKEAEMLLNQIRTSSDMVGIIVEIEH